MKPIGLAAWVWCLSLPSLAAGPPPDAAIDPTAVTKTLSPKVVVDSGRLEWEPYKRDLSVWPTLSHLDRRSVPPPQQAAYSEPLQGDVLRGKAIAMDPARGNCIACHRLPGDDWPGSIGYSLIGYKRHAHPNAYVYQQVYDRRLLNPNTVMPPFGAFGLLSDQEIRDLVAYIQSLE